MRITKESQQLFTFMDTYVDVSDTCIPPIKINKKSQKILLHFYEDIQSSIKKVETINPRYSIQHFPGQIARPNTFSMSDFPENIRTDIDSHIKTLLVYTVDPKVIEGRKITIYLMTDTSKPSIKTYSHYVDYMLVWLNIVNVYASKECVKELKVYLYLIDAKKILPNSNTKVLDQSHINTAFTRSCSLNAEIVVFRKEEWFKVFMHETFHNFGLDFSTMNMAKCTKRMLALFNVDSQVNLFEAYAETWARIWNVLFCSYIHIGSQATQSKESKNIFLNNVEYFMNIERVFGFFQMTKVLKFMNLSYTDLITWNHAKKHLYKEDTNVLAYYIITQILFDRCLQFLTWCADNNQQGILQFQLSVSNLDKFCAFIENNYHTKSIMNGIQCISATMPRIDNQLKKEKNKRNHLDYGDNTLRMTICELG